MKLHLAPLVFVLFALGSFSQSSAQPASVSSLERIATEAGTNRTEILRALSDAPEAKREAMGFLINATCKDNRLIVRTSANVTNAAVFLDQRLVDFDEPLAIEINGQALKPMKVRTNLRVLCETLIRRGDPEHAFTARLDLPRTRIFHTELKVGTPRCGVPAPYRRGTSASRGDQFVALGTECSAAERGGDGAARHPYLGFVASRGNGHDMSGLNK